MTDNNESQTTVEKEPPYEPLSGDDLERMDAAGVFTDDEVSDLIQSAIYYREQALEGLLRKDVLAEVFFALDRTSYCGIADRARVWLRNGIPPWERRATALSARTVRSDLPET